MIPAVDPVPHDDPDEKQQFPTVGAILRRGRTAFSWIVPACPFCGQKHVHGGGPIDGDPRGFLSHRVAHCAPGTQGAVKEADRDPA